MFLDDGIDVIDIQVKLYCNACGLYCKLVSLITVVLHVRDYIVNSTNVPGRRACVILMGRDASRQRLVKRLWMLWVSLYTP